MKKTGIIQSLNVSPKGFYEGFLLKAGKEVIQVNLPKDQIHGSGSHLSPGAEVTAEVKASNPAESAGHAVFTLVRFVGGDDAANEGWNPSIKFDGIVKRLNYALHGEVNGGILDSGDFLHLKPEGARAVSLEAGIAVKGRGRRTPMVGGHWVIEADEVNGIATERHHKAKTKHAR